MKNVFNATKVAKEILTNLVKTKVSTGIKVAIGRKGSELRKIELTKAFRGYDAVRKSINRQTEIYYDEPCIISINGTSMEFKGGKFSNELLKMLERTTTAYYSGGDHINEDENFKRNLQVVKQTFLNQELTIVDLLPIAAQFAQLDKKQTALLGNALAEHGNFKTAIEATEKAIVEAIEAKKLEDAQN